MRSDGSSPGCGTLIVGLLLLSWIVRGVAWLAGVVVQNWPLVVGWLGGAAVLALAVWGLCRALAARRRRRARQEELWFVEFPPDPVPPAPRKPARRPRHPPPPAEPPRAGEATCLVCNSRLESDVIYCRRCGTPHHRECFRYAGRCSIYGCRSRQYRKSAPRAREYTLSLP